MAEEVLIDFKVDYTELINAQEQLSKSGKIDAAGFSVLNKAISSTATDTKGLIQEFKKVATTATQLGKSVESAFGAGVQDALDEAGVSLKDFSTALTKANVPAKTLKAELRELKEALAQAKANGKDTGAEFDALRARAGKLADAIGDAGAEIKNAGSDTRQLDNVVGSISALAGGFAAAQGAVALFGDENQDLQKALLKVNGAMALASGIQQFYNATLKEGALTKLADTISTGTQTVAQRTYALAIGTSTGALKAFRVALFATGISAAIVLIIALVQAMKDYSEQTDTASKVTDDLNTAIENLNAGLSEIQDKISLQGKIQLEALKQRGASEKELNDKTLEFLKYQKEAIEDNNKKRIEEINTALEGVGLYGKGLVKNKKDADELVKSLTRISAALPEGNAQKTAVDAAISATEELAANFKAVSEIETDIVLKKEEFITKTVLDGIKKRKEDAEKESKEAKERRALELNDQLAALERQLLAVEKNSQAEVEIKKRIIAQKARIDLNAEKLGENQKALIRERALNDQLELQKVFNDKATAFQLQAQIDTNAALLAGLNVTNEERLRLQIENINTTSQLEINAAEGNAAKILAIEAKKQADIRALRIADIDKQTADELNSNSRSKIKIKEALAVLSKDYTKSREVRVGAIIAEERQELKSIDILSAANEEKKNKQLISDKEYQDNVLKYAEERVAISEDANEKIGESDKEAIEKRKEALIALGQLTIQIAGQVADFFAQLSSLATEQERQRIDMQKKQLEALVEAGAITEKQAKIRAQEIEILERKLRQRQAQREKQAATFKALLAIPQAFLTGLTQSLPLAIIYAALAAAQAALIIARPVPKFFRGKKDNYEGRGVVADMGSEIVERGGRMFLYTKPTQTYLGARDKVYTAAETRTIMHNTNINTTVAKEKQERFDYDKFARSIPKNSISLIVDKDFITESVAEGMFKNRYLNKRFKSW